MISDSLIRNEMIKDLVRYQRALTQLADIKLDLDCQQAYLPIDQKSQQYKEFTNTMNLLRSMIDAVQNDLVEYDNN